MKDPVKVQYNDVSKSTYTVPALRIIISNYHIHIHTQMYYLNFPANTSDSTSSASSKDNHVNLKIIVSEAGKCGKNNPLLLYLSIFKNNI